MSDKPTQKEYWSGKVGDEWAAHADRIDAMLRPVTQAALDLAALQPGERVLDIGCGAGATSLHMARTVGAAGAVTGVDLSPPLLAVARARAAANGLTVGFIEADAGTIAFDAPFDAAFSRFGVMFFEDPAAGFANIRRALKRGGRLAFVCWRAMALNSWAVAAVEAVTPMLRTPLPAPDPDAPGPFALADADKIARVLSAAGWRDVALAPWDGDMAIGGGGSLEETAEFMLRIGPCARAVADQGLDAEEARLRVLERLAPLHGPAGVLLPGACWLAQAQA